MESIFVSEGSGGEPPTPTTPAEFVQEIQRGRPTDNLEIAKSLDAGFFPLRAAFRADATLRERFSGALNLPRAARYRKIRPFLLVGVVPALMLLELDRELAADHVEGAPARMALDIVLLLTCVADLSRPIPRHPRVTALVFLHSALRFALLLARACGQGSHALILAAPFIGLAAAIATATASPTRDRIDHDILEALALAPEPPQKSVPKAAAIWGALAIAILLPAALLASGRAFGLWGQAIVMVAWGLLLPQRAVPDVDRLSPRRSPYFSWSDVFSATVIGVALTAALSGGAHYGVDAVAHAVQCTHTAASEGAVHLLARESAEVSRNVNEAQHDISFFLMTAFLAPLIEERVYRGALQRVLGQRFGQSRAVAIAAAIFGFAHLGIYRLVIYQTLLLGIAFGVAFEEGGLVASILTHVIWNAYLLL